MNIMRYPIKPTLFSAVEHKNVLVEKWLPQKSLLSSGLISVFISSCGNNARLEAIYFQVPLICVPLYGEQPMISNIVKYNGHGVILNKEGLSEKRIIRALNETFENLSGIKQKMKRSVDILKMSPVSQEDQIGHHVKMLVEFGKTSHYDPGVPKGLIDIIDYYNIDLFTFGFIILTISINIGKLILLKAIDLFLNIIRKNSVIVTYY